MNQNIKVSIICTTYNHEAYIEKALQGFVSQKTSFPFEVIVHDDKSTDKTADIIKKYADRYPAIIVPFLETENQYSKGKDVAMISCARARGEYIAFCEGDDYWTVEDKLKKQIDYLDSHKECAACSHNAIKVDAQGNYLGDYNTTAIEDTFVTAKDIIDNMWFFPTASLVARKSVFDKYLQLFNTVPLYDYILKIALADSSPFYYFANKMSAYRCETPGSWSLRISHSKKKSIEFLQQTNRSLTEGKKYFSIDTNKSVNGMILNNQFKIDMYRGKFFKAFFSKDYESVRKTMPKCIMLSIALRGLLTDNVFYKLRSLKNK